MLQLHSKLPPADFVESLRFERFPGFGGRRSVFYYFLVVFTLTAVTARLYLIFPVGASLGHRQGILRASSGHRTIYIAARTQGVCSGTGLSPFDAHSMPARCPGDALTMPRWRMPWRCPDDALTMPRSGFFRQNVARASSIYKCALITQRRPLKPLKIWRSPSGVSGARWASVEMGHF